MPFRYSTLICLRQSGHLRPFVHRTVHRVAQLTVDGLDNVGPDGSREDGRERQGAGGLALRAPHIDS